MTGSPMYLKKIIINCLISAAIITGAILGFIVPAAEKLIDAKKEIAAQKIILEEAYIKGLNLKKTSEDLKTVEPELDNLKKIFINENEDVNFITALEKIAENSNITQKININYPAENNKNKKINFQRIPLQLTSSGTFLSQMKYLTALESLNYYISIRTLEIVGTPIKNLENAENLREGEKSRADMQLTANTYWQ